MTELKSMTLEELEAYFKELGQPKFRAGQVFGWLHHGAESFGEMSNLPAPCGSGWRRSACSPSPGWSAGRCPGWTAR